MHKHHVIPRHEWKVRFGNLDGFNASDNVVSLTVEQHAQAHLLLFELNHSEYDRIAYLALSKEIGKEETHKRAISVANTGNKYTLGLKRSEDQKRKHSEFMRGKQYTLGYKFGDEFRRNVSVAMTGNTNGTGFKHTKEWKLAKSASMIGIKRGPYKKKAVI